MILRFFNNFNRKYIEIYLFIINILFIFALRFKAQTN